MPAYNFHDRLDRLGVRMKELNWHPVTINGVTIHASRAKTEREEVSPTGGITVGSYRDYIFDVDNLVVNRVPFLPEKGMEIVDGNITSQIVPIGEESCYRYTTATRKRIRVHTKIVSIT